MVTCVSYGRLCLFVREVLPYAITAFASLTGGSILAGSPEVHSST